MFDDDDGGDENTQRAYWEDEAWKYRFLSDRDKDAPQVAESSVTTELTEGPTLLERRIQEQMEMIQRASDEDVNSAKFRVTVHLRIRYPQCASQSLSKFLVWINAAVCRHDARGDSVVVGANYEKLEVCRFSVGDSSFDIRTVVQQPCSPDEQDAILGQAIEAKGFIMQRVCRPLPRGAGVLQATKASVLYGKIVLQYRDENQEKFYRLNDNKIATTPPVEADKIFDELKQQAQALAPNERVRNLRIMNVLRKVNWVEQLSYSPEVRKAREREFNPVQGALDTSVKWLGCNDTIPGAKIAVQTNRGFVMPHSQDASGIPAKSIYWVIPIEATRNAQERIPYLLPGGQQGLYAADTYYVADKHRILLLQSPLLGIARAMQKFNPTGDRTIMYRDEMFSEASTISSVSFNPCAVEKDGVPLCTSTIADKFELETISFNQQTFTTSFTAFGSQIKEIFNRATPLVFGNAGEPLTTICDVCSYVLSTLTYDDRLMESYPPLFDIVVSKLLTNERHVRPEKHFPLRAGKVDAVMRDLQNELGGTITEPKFRRFTPQKLGSQDTKPAVITGQCGVRYVENAIKMQSEMLDSYKFGLLAIAPSAPSLDSANREIFQQLNYAVSLPLDNFRVVHALYYPAMPNATTSIYDAEGFKKVALELEKRKTSGAHLKVNWVYDYDAQVSCRTLNEVNCPIVLALRMMVAVERLCVHVIDKYRHSDIRFALSTRQRQGNEASKLDFANRLKLRSEDDDASMINIPDADEPFTKRGRVDENFEDQHRARLLFPKTAARSFRGETFAGIDSREPLLAEPEVPLPLYHDVPATTIRHKPPSRVRFRKDPT
jgi:hypothetical protein